MKIPMTGGSSSEAMQTSTMGLALQSKEELPGMQSPLVRSRVDTAVAVSLGNWEGLEHVGKPGGCVL